MVPLALKTCLSDGNRENAGRCTEQDVSCSAANTQLTNLGSGSKNTHGKLKKQGF